MTSNDAPDPTKCHWSSPQQEPFAHPFAVARQTEKWPDVVAICGAGTALVDPTAFEETHGSRSVQFVELCKDHQWEKAKQILTERPNLVNCVPRQIRQKLKDADRMLKDA
eukprot:Skav227918  [mRNA]  locus=scaffold146:156765:158611:+ [translate_table: standard]